MARKVDMNLIAQLNKGAEGQVVKGGSQKTTDSNFPVFSTPINEDILVYIPKTNVIKSENGEELKLLHSHLHSYTNGKRFGQLRCVTGLAGGPFDVLEYDGSCPACEAMGEVWDLYNKKIGTEAAKIGIDPQNDTTDMLKGVREKARKEMDLQTAEEYVTFPIVIIPQKDRFTAADDAKDNLQVQFVTWRKKRYDKNIGEAIAEGIDGDAFESPAGLFWSWKFTYDTQGKPATARDSAREAKYNILNTSSAKLAPLKKLEKACEEVAKEFTNEKAIEVIVANQFMFKEDIQTEVDKIMAKTRGLLEASNINAVTTPGLQAPATGADALANFGNAPSENLGVEKVEFGN